MAEFLRLERAERAEILRGLAPTLGKAPLVLEKDVWVCWVLKHLFEMPGRRPMAFKGGTSLSKVFEAISRFSEDVDVTLDYRGLDATADPFAEGVSKSQLGKLGERLRELVRVHVHGVIAPRFVGTLAEQFGEDVNQVEVSDDGERLRIHYPSALDEAAGYVPSSVLVEFGGRNITEPAETHRIKPYIAEAVSDLGFPEGEVTVLSPSRTFWEKATLIHVECHRKEFRVGVDRLSRHWYDLARLADHAIGRAAIADRALLADVVKHKKVFFNSSFANYDACLAGQLRLLPDDGVLPLLRADFEKMIEAGMFYGEPPSFDPVVRRLRELEAEVNSTR